MLEYNKIYNCDCLEGLKRLEDNSIDSIVSDFPYNLSFMGKKWDTISNFYEWCNDRAKEMLRVLKHGGYCLIFGGSRTSHRMVCAFEDVGFEIRDTMMWLYGSGFPKSYNISKGFDKLAGVEREKFENPLKNKQTGQKVGNSFGSKNANEFITPNPITDLAKQWDGWGTALKPSHEPIMMAQKPIEKNYCYNIKKWGVGGLNIDDSRIPHNEPVKTTNRNGREKALVMNDDSCGFDNTKNTMASADPKGRFPANILLDEEAGKLLDQQSGTLKSGSNNTRTKDGCFFEHTGLGGGIQVSYGDSGGASRFFYCAKATQKDKTENGQVENKHPTVKPTKLIKYLVRLVTPKNGICLDVCEGSGTHAKACMELTQEDYPVNFIGFELEKEYCLIAQERLKEVTNARNK